MRIVFHHGVVTTMNPALPKAEAVLISEGRIAAVGSSDEILAQTVEGDELHDLHGAAVYPGLIDSHLHILNLGVTSQQLELNQVRSRRDALSAVHDYVSAFPKGAALRGRGFNQDLWADDVSMLTRADLDAVAPEHAITLTRVCGHMAVANSLAIRQAGITEATPNPDGGVIDLPNGLFYENAVGLLTPADAGVEACKRMLCAGMAKAADAGLTAIFTDDFGAGGFAMDTVVAAYRELEQQGRMPVRVVQQCALPDDAAWQAFRAAGLAYGQGSDQYRIGPRKMFADGSLGAHTAWLTAPYADAPELTGVPIYTQDELNHLAAQSHLAGMPVIVHAIGNAAADSVLKAILYAREQAPGTEDLPSGIVHCQITSPELLQRIIDAGVSIYAQPVFTEYDLHICRDRVGEALEKSSYNWKTLYDAGVCISAGSDCPVEPLDPAKNIYCAVTRKDFDGTPAGGWMPEQRLTVVEAIACHTVKAAEAAGMADRMGRIAPGYLADLTVFPAPLDAIPADDILHQKPLMTVVGGVIRSCKQS